MANCSAWEPGLSWWSGLQKNSLSRASSSSIFYAAAAYPFGTAKTSHVSFAEIVHNAKRYNAKSCVLEVVAVPGLGVGGFRRRDRSSSGVTILQLDACTPICRPQRWEHPGIYRLEAAVFMFVYIVSINHCCHPKIPSTTSFLAQNFASVPITFARQRNGSQVLRPFALCNNTRPTIAAAFSNTWYLF